MTENGRELLYEGKAKKIFKGPADGQYIMQFKDAATAFNNKKKAKIAKKGALNLKISAKLFEYLKKNGVPSHFIETLDEQEALIQAVEIIQVEIVIRNITAGSIVKRLGLKPKMELDPPLCEYFLKNDELDDPLLTHDHVRIMNLATPKELEKMKELALKVNELLRAYFKKLGIILVDFKLEFGRTKDGKILLADEITPDGCRLWDEKTLNILDKDRFRQDLGGLIEAYEVVWARMQQGHA